MAIKVKCNCGVRFQAKDQLAGKKVKCPKCSNPIRIPNPQAAAVTSSSSAPAPVSPLEDLLNEIGVSQNAPATGPLCPSCQSSIKANDILCVQCGYDLKTGQRLETVSYSEVDEMAGLSETEKLLAKAEKEIDDIPIASDEVDFGDGAGAYVVAAVVAVAAFIIIAITMTSTILLRMFGDNFGAGPMAAVSLTFIFVIGFLWITIAGFIENPKIGVCCVFIPLFPAIYAIKRALWLPIALVTPMYFTCMILLIMAMFGVDVVALFEPPESS